MPSKKPFIKKIVDFLILLENEYPNHVDKEILQNKFDTDYARIVEYLTRIGKDGRQLIIQNNEKTGWRLNNWYTMEIQEIIGRSINEDLLREQSVLWKKQNYFNLVIAVTGGIVSLLMLFDFTFKYFNLKIENFPPLFQAVVFIFFIILIISIVAFVWKNMKNINKRQ